MEETIKQKLLIEEKKKKLREQELMLKEKERRQMKKRFVDLGMIVSKAKISNLDENALFGAFLEIAEKSTDDKNINKWIEKSKKRK